MKLRSLHTAAVAIVAVITILFSATAAMPSATAVDVEHTFVVRIQRFLLLRATIYSVRILVLSELRSLEHTHACVYIGEPDEHDAHVHGDVRRCGQRSTTRAGDRGH